MAFYSSYRRSPRGIYTRDRMRTCAFVQCHISYEARFFAKNCALRRNAACRLASIRASCSAVKPPLAGVARPTPVVTRAPEEAAAPVRGVAIVVVNLVDVAIVVVRSIRSVPALRFEFTVVFALALAFTGAAAVVSSGLLPENAVVSLGGGPSVAAVVASRRWYSASI